MSDQPRRGRISGLRQANDCLHWLPAELDALQGRAASYRMWMRTTISTRNMAGQEEAGPSTLTAVSRAIVVVDVVESVRLVQAFEADVIDRWRRFVAEVRQQMLPAQGGRLVKSLGDGMLLEFDSSPKAAAVAVELHRRVAAYNLGRSAEAAIYLRIGAHTAEVFSDELDVYGAGVNLAARLCGLAAPGETVASADFRADLVEGLDPEVHDLGECELKHIRGSVRAFRLGKPAAHAHLPAFDTLWQERPTFAVLPLHVDAHDLEAGMIAEVVCDQVIHELSLCGEWRVISRLSMVAFKGRNASLEEVAQHLKPTWVVSGRCRVIESRVRFSLEVADVRTSSVIWNEVVEGSKAELLQTEGTMGARIVESMLRAIFNFELQRSRTSALPTLNSHTLLFAAIALMHRVSAQDFMRGRGLLEQLCERHPRAPEPHAWFAKWHVMNVVQGWADDIPSAAQAGQRCAQRALDERSDHALGLAVDGLIAGLLHKNLDHSLRSYEAAIAANHNESLAWLFMSALHAYCDRGPEAAAAAEIAMRLSPLDPIRYFYDSFAAHAMLAADRTTDAILLAQRSLRANGSHIPTHRTLAIAQALAGQAQEARHSVARLLQVAPQYSVSDFLKRYPGSDSALALRSAQALKDSGLPLN